MVVNFTFHGVDGKTKKRDIGRCHLRSRAGKDSWLRERTRVMLRTDMLLTTCAHHFEI
jgi:hypothetical protein